MHRHCIDILRPSSDTHPTYESFLTDDVEEAVNLEIDIGDHEEDVTAEEFSEHEVQLAPSELENNLSCLRRSVIHNKPSLIQNQLKFPPSEKVSSRTSPNTTVSQLDQFTFGRPNPRSRFIKQSLVDIGSDIWDKPSPSGNLDAVYNCYFQPPKKLSTAKRSHSRMKFKQYNPSLDPYGPKKVDLNPILGPRSRSSGPPLDSETSLAIPKPTLATPSVSKTRPKSSMVRHIRAPSKSVIGHKCNQVEAPSLPRR
jgi:hypothetical protein